MQNRHIRVAVWGLLVTLAALGAAGPSLAQTGPTIPDLEPGCASLMVVDFVADAEGRAMQAGDAVSSQYRLWGVDIAAWSDAGLATPTVAEMSATTGPTAALRVGLGQSGTVSFGFRNLVSVLAVELIGAVQDGAKIRLYDPNSATPAVVPVTPSQANEIRTLPLETLDAVTRVDVVLTEGSGLAALYLCPLSSPKVIPKHNFPSLSVDATVGRDELRAGETADLAVTVANTGYSVGYDLTLFQQLPPGLVFADDGLRERTWDLGAIGSKGSFTVGYQIKAESVAESTALPTYLTAFISNGRGSDGVASDRMVVALIPGAVLGTGTPEPGAPAEPVTPTEPAAPAEPRLTKTPSPPLTPLLGASPTPTPRPRPTATPTPSVEPIGGPVETASPVMEPRASEPKVEATPKASPESPFGDGTIGEPLVVPAQAGDLATMTATTTPGLLASCTNWLNILAVLNAALIAMLALRERKAAKEGGSRWVVAMLVAAVPLIIWYPACELTYWLALTAVGVSAILYIMAHKGGPPGAITASPDLPVPGDQARRDQGGGADNPPIIPHPTPPDDDAGRDSGFGARHPPPLQPPV